MADIDIELAIVGTQQATDQVRGFAGSVEGLRMTTIRTAVVLRTLEGALSDIRTTGELSTGTIISIGSVIPLLSNPVIAAGAAVGFLVLQLNELRNFGKSDREKSLAEMFKEDAVQAHAALVAAKDLAGARGREREIIAALIEEKEVLRKEESTLNDIIAHQAELVKAGTITSEDAQASIKKDVDYSSMRAEAAAGRIVDLEKELDALRKLHEEEGIQVADQELMIKEYGKLSDAAEHYIGQAATGAFMAYADAVDLAITARRVDMESFGRALRNVAAQTLLTIGSEAAVKGAMELAEGLRATAFGIEGDPAAAASAGGHFASAAEFFRTAALAGVGAGALSVAPGAGGSTGRGRMGHADRERFGGGIDTAGGSGVAVYQHITVIGDLDTTSRESLALQLREAETNRHL